MYKEIAGAGARSDRRPVLVMVIVGVVRSLTNDERTAVCQLCRPTRETSTSGGQTKNRQQQELHDTTQQYRTRGQAPPPSMSRSFSLRLPSSTSAILSIRAAWC